MASPAVALANAALVRHRCFKLMANSFLIAPAGSITGENETNPRNISVPVSITTRDTATTLYTVQTTKPIYARFDAGAISITGSNYSESSCTLIYVALATAGAYLSSMNVYYAYFSKSTNTTDYRYAAFYLAYQSGAVVGMISQAPEASGYIKLNKLTSFTGTLTLTIE